VACGRTKRFLSRINFFLTPLVFFSRVEGGRCSGVGVGTYTKYDVAEVYASCNRCMLHAYPNALRSSTVFGALRAYKS
jgi:hypothetical protein